jgi:hypothetical protein
MNFMSAISETRVTELQFCLLGPKVGEQLLRIADSEIQS